MIRSRSRDKQLDSLVRKLQDILTETIVYLLHKAEHDILKHLSHRQSFFSSSDFTKNTLLYLLRVMGRNNNHGLQLVTALETQYKSKRITLEMLQFCLCVYKEWLSREKSLHINNYMKNLLSSFVT